MYSNKRFVLKKGLQIIIGMGIFIGCLSKSSLAQQTLFNVPQTDIIEANNLFFQQQITISDQLQSMTILTYGIGGNWQVGMNINNVTLHRQAGSKELLELHSSHPEENPSLLVHLQKGIHVADWLDIGIGSQTGAGYIHKPSQIKLASFSYLANQLTLVHVIKLIAGGYYTTQAYAGEGTNIGYMVGFQLPLIEDKFTFDAEYISGTNQYSNCIAGFGFRLGKSWQLVAGAQIPSPGSNNSYGVTLQLSSQ